jgi:hypothetical protein
MECNPLNECCSGYQKHLATISALNVGAMALLVNPINPSAEMQSRDFQGSGPALRVAMLLKKSVMERRTRREQTSSE